ncbi:MAG: hypothetical protein HN521_13150 [Candidatus Latescibacteria bacterium]|nr:hypothetical protein [Candidatus Latescibacterota bacterium]
MATESFDHPFLNKIRTLGLLFGALFLVLTVIGAISNPQQFYQSYIIGYVYWLCISLGCLSLLMLHHLISGRWGFVIRRLLESGARTLPLMVILFIPIIFGMHNLYEWTHADVVANDPILKFKSPYLNETGFISRAVFYFVLWIGMTWLLTKWSRTQDETGEPGLKSKMINLSGPGIPVLILSVTFASTDWVMSLEPHWFSTIFGFIFVVGQALAAMAMCIIWVVNLSDADAFSEIEASKYLSDLGTLMFAFTVLWSYVSFSQFLIIWSANLAEEAPWYIKRGQGGWDIMAVALILFHFALPFFLLLQRAIKRRAALLLAIAVLMLVMRYVDLYWYIAPSFSHGGPSEFHPHFLDLTIPLSIGGFWLAYFAMQLKGAALVPLHDPRMAETFAGEGH